MNKILKEMTLSMVESVRILRDSITNVRPAGFNSEMTKELISFEIISHQLLKPEIAGKYIGELSGRNRDFCIGFSEDADKGIAVRVFIDGCAKKL